MPWDKPMRCRNFLAYWLSLAAPTFIIAHDCLLVTNMRTCTVSFQISSSSITVAMDNYAIVGGSEQDDLFRGMGFYFLNGVHRINKIGITRDVRLESPFLHGSSGVCAC